MHITQMYIALGRIFIRCTCHGGPSMTVTFLFIFVFSSKSLTDSKGRSKIYMTCDSKFGKESFQDEYIFIWQSVFFSSPYEYNSYVHLKKSKKHLDFFFRFFSGLFFPFYYMKKSGFFFLIFQKFFFLTKKYKKIQFFLNVVKKRKKNPK